MRKNLLLSFSLFLIATPSFAAKFANQFVEFELPLKWECKLEGAEWVCQGTDDQKRKDAIIVLAAKLKGEQDSLDKYQDYLGKARSFTAINGKATTSQPRYAKVIDINGHPWVDSIHLESEIPGFFTRYLATVKNDIGVLVTYSINKAKYQDYLSQFDSMVKSMKVFRKAGGINTNTEQSLFDNAKVPTVFSDAGTFAEGETPKEDKSAPKKAAESKDDDTIFYLFLAGAVVLGYIIWRKRRGGGV